MCSRLTPGLLLISVRTAVPEPAVKCAHTTGPGHHCCLPWSLVTGYRGITGFPNSPCGPHSSHGQGSPSCDGLQLSEPMGHGTPNPNPGATTCQHIQCPEPLNLGPQFLFLQNSVSIFFFFSIGAQRAKISGITNHRGISLLIDAKP